MIYLLEIADQKDFCQISIIGDRKLPTLTAASVGVRMRQNLDSEIVADMYDLQISVEVDTLKRTFLVKLLVLGIQLYSQFKKIEKIYFSTIYKAAILLNRSLSFPLLVYSPTSQSFYCEPLSKSLINYCYYFMLNFLSEESIRVNTNLSLKLNNYSSFNKQLNFKC